MILISHRGNTAGRRPTLENSLTAIRVAIEAGYDVEIDVQDMTADYILLGHDKVDHVIDTDFIRPLKDKLWCHAKNIPVLGELLKEDFHCFYHETDKATLTSKGYIWTYPGYDLTSRSICLFPDVTKDEYRECAGICSDNIQLYEGIKDGQVDRFDW